MKRRRSCPLPYLYIILRGSLCFEADEHTFVDVPTLFHGIRDEMRFREIFILFYLFFSFSWFNFNRNIFFLPPRWPNLTVYYPGWWDDRLNFAAGRKISGNVGRVRENGSESGKFGRDRRSNEISRSRPSPPEFFRVTPNLGTPRILKCWNVSTTLSGSNFSEFFFFFFWGYLFSFETNCIIARFTRVVWFNSVHRYYSIWCWNNLQIER